MKKLFYFVLILNVAFSLLSCSKSEHGAVSGTSAAAPSFTLSDLQKHTVSLEDYKNRVVMLEFFASWCPPCRMSAPEIKSVYEKYKDKGLVVLAISIDKGPDAEDAVRSFVKEFDLPYPALMDDGKASSRYGVVSIPTSVVIDKQGNIRNRHIGLSPDFSTTLSKEVEALL